jgi:hypothetical protein
MPISFRVTSYVEEDRYISVFGQLVFTGNYATGGDVLLNAAGAAAPEILPPGLPANTASMPVFLNGQTAVHATRQPLVWNVAIESGYNPVLVPGSGAFNFKIKLFDPSTKAELAAGAYPASVIAAVFNTLELRFKKNI